MAAKGIVCTSRELFFTQGISILQIETWNPLTSFLSSPWQSRTQVEPLSCLLVQRLACSVLHRCGDSCGVLVRSQIHIYLWPLQRWRNGPLRDEQAVRLSTDSTGRCRGEGGRVIHSGHQSCSPNHSENRSPRVRT